MAGGINCWISWTGWQTTIRCNIFIQDKLKYNNSPRFQKPVVFTTAASWNDDEMRAEEGTSGF
jgi:hypothetical protein